VGKINNEKNPGAARPARITGRIKNTPQKDTPPNK
jgi:hypothetical protein